MRTYPVILMILLLLVPITGFTESYRNPKSEAWREDLQTLSRYLPALDRSFGISQLYYYSRNRELLYLRMSPLDPEADGEKQLSAFYREVDALYERIPRMHDNQIIVAFARLVAMADNAHTRLYLLRNRNELRHFPIDLYAFEDGVFVVQTDSENRAALGKRIVRIHETDIHEARRLCDALYAGNASWKAYMAAYLLGSPEILNGLGIIPADDEATFAFADGSRLRVKPLPAGDRELKREAWRALSPVNLQGRFSKLQSDSKLPLYLQNPDQPYWARLLPGKAMYFQHNRTVESEESFADFIKRIVGEMQREKVGHLIVDLRFNTGGDLTITSPVIRALAADPSRKLTVTVLVSNATFSAGISSVVEYKHDFGARVIGEPVGDRLRFWSEGGRFTLPHSGYVVKYADGYHDWTFGNLINLHTFSTSSPNFDIFDYTGKRELVLDKVVPMRSADYFAGHDPLLEEALKTSD